MVSPEERDRKACVDLRDNQAPKDLREGQVAKELKEHRVRKVPGERKDLAGTLDPRENRDFQVNPERKDRLDRQERRERRVNKERQGHLGRKEREDPRVLLVLAGVLVFLENLGLLVQPVKLAPRELQVRGGRKEMTGIEDHRALRDLRVLRAFLVQEERRENEALVDRRDPKACLDHEDHQDQQELRVIKGRLVIPEVMDDQEPRGIKVPRVMQAALEYPEHRADLV